MLRLRLKVCRVWGSGFRGGVKGSGSCVSWRQGLVKVCSSFKILGASVDLVSKGTYLIQLGVYNDGYGYLL